MNELMNELFCRVQAMLPPDLASRISWVDDGGDEDGWQVLLILDGGSTRNIIGFSHEDGWEKQAFSLGEMWWQAETIESLAQSVAALYESLTRAVPEKLPY